MDKEIDLPKQPEHDKEAKDPSSPPGMPRWVKILAIVLVTVLAALVVVMLIVGDDHGPGRHDGSLTSGAISISSGHWQ